MGELEGRERHAEAAVDCRGAPAWRWMTPRLAICGSATASPMVRTRAAGTWRAWRNSSHSSAVRVEHDLGQHRGLARRGRASRSSLVRLIMSGRSSTVHSRRCWRRLLAPSITMPSLVFVGAVGGVGMAVAVRLGMGAVAQIAGQMRAHQDHRDVEHRHVDALAAAGALALEQRGRQREGAGRAGRVVDRRRADLHGVTSVGAGHRHDAGGRLDHVVVGGLLAARPVLAEGRERGIDQARIDRGAAPRSRARAPRTRRAGSSRRTRRRSRPAS